MTFLKIPTNKTTINPKILSCNSCSRWINNNRPSPNKSCFLTKKGSKESIKYHLRSFFPRYPIVRSLWTTLRIGVGCTVPHSETWIRNLLLISYRVRSFYWSNLKLGELLTHLILRNFRCWTFEITLKELQMLLKWWSTFLTTVIRLFQVSSILWTWSTP